MAEEEDQKTNSGGNGAKKGDGGEKGSAPKKRRRPRRRKPKKKTEELATPDLAVTEEQVGEKLDNPIDDAPSEKASPFDLTAEAASKEPPPADPTPADPPSSTEPSPFDLAAAADFGSSSKPKKHDPFGDYQSSFGGANDEPKQEEPPASEPSLDPFQPSPVPDPPADPFAMASSEPALSPEPPASDPPTSFDPVAEPASDPFSLASSPSSELNNDEPKRDEPKVEKIEESPAPFDDPAAGPLPPSMEPAPADPFGETESGPDHSPVETGEVMEGEVIETAAPEEAPETEGSLEDLEMSGSFMDRIQQLMHEANLTTRHLKFCCSGVVIIVLIIVVAFVLAPKLLSGGWNPFDGGEDRPPRDEVVEAVEEEDTTVEEEVVIEEEEIEVSGQVWVDPSIYSGILIGDPKATFEGDTGVESGVLVGDEEEVGQYLTDFQKYIGDLEDLYNLYFVDLDHLLDSSTNRTNALDEHITELKDYYNLGVDNYEAIQAVQAELSEEFNANEPIKEEAELTFFEELEAFEGQSAENTLLEFIEWKQVQSDLKAQYYAYEKLNSMYETVLASMFDRIQDIEANREALIADVQVVDFEGSDIDLILTEFDLEE